MDCENCGKTQFRKQRNSFLNVGRNCNKSQFNFLQMVTQNCESCENYYAEDFFEKLVNRNWNPITGF